MPIIIAIIVLILTPFNFMYSDKHDKKIVDEMFADEERREKIEEKRRKESERNNNS